MSEAKQTDSDDLEPEYDFASTKGGVRGKYVARLANAANLVLLDPDVARAFPSDDAVNEALRGVLNTTRAVRERGGLSNETLLQQTARRSKRVRKPRSEGTAT